MSNYNFFDPYIASPRKTNYKKILVFILLIAFVAALVWFFLLMQDKIENLKVEKIELKQYIESKEIKEQLKEAQQIENSINGYREKLLMLNMVTVIDQSLNIFDDTVFDMLNRIMPNDVFIESLVVSNANITINGYGDSIESISLFNHRLTAEEFIETSHINSISGEQGLYKYLIFVEQKGGNNEAEK